MTAYFNRATSNVKHLSGYRLMWILITFDLPVEIKKQRYAATKFRQYLLDIGFEMSQLSNYLRFCNGQRHFTDEQYENIVRFFKKIWLIPFKINVLATHLL